MYQYSGKIKPEFVSKALKMLETYREQKEDTVQRVKDDIRIYRQEYAKIYDDEKKKVKAKTGFIFSAIENKVADFSENFPMANLLPREPSDEETAKTLTSIMPTVLDVAGFKKIYKEHTRQKVKKGTGIYGVFWNSEKEDIEIKELDFMSVYVDMNVRDIQESEFLFITEAVSNDFLTRLYPKAKELFTGDASVLGYGTDKERKTMYGKSEITDCYYKKTDGSLHLMKLKGSDVIEATEDIEGYEKGIYRHGKFPVVFDNMYPDDDSPFGFGIIDIIKNPQKYIDDIDAMILKNGYLSGNPKTLLKRGSGINIDDLKDIEKEIIEVSTLDENTIRELKTNPLPQQIISYRQNKILELKEVAGNRDFQQGGVSGGVTSGNAITALQEAGDKLSRSQIDDSYDAYKELITQIIELMREFYDKERVYRITNEVGHTEFKIFSNRLLFGEEPEKDAFGFEKGTKLRNVYFDISVIPQRQNVYKRETNNQVIIQLYQMGLLAPQNAEVAILVLKAMNFDGRDSLIQSLEELVNRQQGAVMAQTPAQIPFAEEGGEI